MTYLGKYRWKHSILHLLDPRVKIIAILVLSILAFFTDFILYFSLLVFFICLLAKIKLKQIFLALRPILPFLLIIFLMYYFFDRFNVNLGLLVIWRFIVIAILATILLISTTTKQLVFAIEKLLSPVKFLKISPRNIATMIDATIRFIPLGAKESQTRREALQARNISYQKNLGAYLQKLFENLIKKADNIAEAMESRLYRETGHTQSAEFKIEKKDIGVIITLTVAIILLL